MFGFKKRTEVLGPQAAGFIAAYSERPFREEKNKAQYPDYTFHKLKNLYWCVRVGDIVIPWGFGRDQVGFAAHGSFTVSRRNVSAVTFDGRGLPYTRIGDVYYLLNENDGDGGCFRDFMRDRLTPALQTVAAGMSPEEFRTAALCEPLAAIDAIAALLREHQLDLKTVTVEHAVK